MDPAGHKLMLFQLTHALNCPVPRQRPILFGAAKEVLSNYKCSSAGQPAELSTAQASGQALRSFQSPLSPLTLRQTPSVRITANVRIAAKRCSLGTLPVTANCAD
jgi:hypothetical protein